MIGADVLLGIGAVWLLANVGIMAWMQRGVRKAADARAAALEQHLSARVDELTRLVTALTAAVKEEASAAMAALDVQTRALEVALADRRALMDIEVKMRGKP